MLFNSGTPNLVSLTRARAGDPSDGANPTWEAADVKQEVNLAIREMRLESGIQGTGVGLRRTYAPTVADQIFYSEHVDFEQLEEIEIEVDGLDLSTTAIADANIVWLEKRREDFAMKMYQKGELSAPRYVFKHDEHFGIVCPVETGGDNAMRMTPRRPIFLMTGMNQIFLETTMS